ncbi:lipoprotein [Acrocarpospora phusangensis]|uniref:Lipoprotein n=1 Tax=Acrocarpospora phusangensis TaxID=1070424 RepID=A0A919QEE8_9ACTN|nr:DUF305 domain-containing protein [Acrocarpospora phusangensis]GIH26421.1 lipoprotein [Acrocarpospora phusangensis]
MRPALALALAALSAAVLTAACSATTRETPLVAGSGAPVVIPDGPGGEGRTATPGERIGTAESRPTGADVRFAELMIPHHRQALEMAGLVAGRTGDRGIAALARRVEAAQRPEVTVLTSWLAALGRVPSHDHPDGYGMATLTEMNRLRTARNADFDRLFLTLMIRHHEGALTMAAEELRDGEDRLMRTLATDIARGQRVEIGRMRGML